MISKIVKPNFENLGFLISNSSEISSILKIIIFVDSIDKAQHITAYLCIYREIFLPGSGGSEWIRSTDPVDRISLSPGQI